MAYKTLLLERQDGVGIITLNRPEKLNALNNALTTELDRALTEYENEEAVKAIVVTGAGDRAFSAGSDIHEMSRMSAAELEELGDHFSDWTWHLAACRKPTIGAINGLAYGGGALMSSLFDIRIGCDRTRFSYLGAAYGRINSTWTLPLIVGMPTAKELLFTGRIVEAVEAKEIGLLNKLVTNSEIVKTAVEMGQVIAANNAPVVQGIKEILVKDIGMGWQEMLVNESRTISRIGVSPPRESFKDFLGRKGKEPGKESSKDDDGNTGD